MPEPQYDGDEELTRLYRALAKSRANTQQIEEAIAEREGVSTPELHQRRRRSIRGVPAWILILIGGLGTAAHRIIHTQPKVLLAAGSLTAATTAAAIALTQLGPHHTHRPPAAQPPRTSATAPPTPPRSTPPTPTSAKSSPSPSPSATGARTPTMGEVTPIPSEQPAPAPPPPITPSPATPRMSPPISRPPVRSPHCLGSLGVGDMRVDVGCGRTPLAVSIYWRMPSHARALLAAKRGTPIVHPPDKT